MRCNGNVNIVGENVVLVPYKRLHVIKYHNWMKSPELQHLTASEPLTIEKEYEMQQSWLEDEDKCTFIILDKAQFDVVGDETQAMIGDTNLFFLDTDNSERTAEAEIMIAEKDARGKKFGWEAMLLMLRYGCEQLAIDKYQVKIAFENIKSISMFSKIGFTEISRSEAFKETTMEKEVTKEWKSWLSEQTFKSKHLIVK